MKEEEILGTVDMKMMDSASSFKPDLCEKCGTPKNKLIEVLGKTYIVPVMCSCRKAARDKEEQQDKALEQQIRLQQIFNNSLMDAQFRNWTFENWSDKVGNPKLRAVGEKYVEKFNSIRNKNIGLLITGKPGNGKSYMTYCIANALMQRFNSVVCISTNALIEKLERSRRFDESTSAYEILNSLNMCDLLILDDLGTEALTETKRATIYNIIDSRYRSMKPIIITTNISKEQISERYGDRTYNRIIEMCSIIQNDWRSIRQSYAVEKQQELQRILGE